MIYDIAPVNNYSGNNFTTTFEFNFYIENSNQLKVTLFDKENVQHVLEVDVDYSIHELKNKNGSYITFPLNSSNYETLGENEKISLELVLPISQETQYNNSSLLNLEALEYSFDYLTRLIQILSRKQELSIKVSEFSEQTPEQLYNELNSSKEYVSQATQDVSSKYTELNSIYQDISKNYEKFNQITINSNSISALKNNIETKLNKDLTNLENQEKEEIMSWGLPDYKNADNSKLQNTIYTVDHPCLVLAKNHIDYGINAATSAKIFIYDELDNLLLFWTGRSSVATGSIREVWISAIIPKSYKYKIERQSASDINNLSIYEIPLKGVSQ